MQKHGISSRDVQLLLWAVGQGRAKDRRQVRDVLLPLDNLAPADGSEFFTEWQPAAR